MNRFLIFLSITVLSNINGVINQEEKEVEIDEDSEYSEKVSTEDEIGAVDEIVDESTIESVDRSDEEWVMPAVLDVAYYLRAHKFNELDRRYYNTINVEDNQYQHFPDPPLMYLHWEVNKFCERGFYECLSYLQDTALKTAIIRSLDTNVIMNEREWEYPRNAKSIEAVDKECRRLWYIDWKDADPFRGPLERFQWRVSASYYMCHFTMQNLSPLMMFGERCDNHAACLDGKEPFNGDPRADNTKPYQCALYSFCPEICCPLKKIKEYDECLDYPKNPCYWVSDRSKRECGLHREENRDLPGMAMNMWNLTCHCDAGYEWESMFGACVDIDECSVNSHNCNNLTETCLNMQGHFACVCAWGFLNVSGSCVPNTILVNALSRLHQHYTPPSLEPPRPFSLYKTIFNWTVARFFHSLNTDVNNTTTESNLIDFYSE